MNHLEKEGIFPKGSNDGAEVLTCCIQFKGVILHTNVKFCKETVTNAFEQNVGYDGQGILFPLSLFNWRRLLIQQTVPSFLE